MLTQLSIQNILLIKACDISFTAGLNVLTGETGAGKSILLDALGLVLGERSDAGLVRSGAAQASVTGSFELADDHPARALLAELELGTASELVIRRILTAEGKSKAFINDAPVAITTLKRLGELLIARHGQHDQRGLLDMKTHRTVLDAFAGNRSLLAATEAACRRYKAAVDEAEMLAERAREAAREEEWLRRTVEELSALAPEDDEETAIMELRKRASENKVTGAAIEQAIALLTESDGVALMLRQVAKLTAKIPSLELSATEALERAEAEVESISVALERARDAAAFDPRAVEAAEDRLHSLRSAARKYNVAVALLPGLLSDAQGKVSLLTNLAAEQKRASAALVEAEAAYRAAAMALYEARAAASEKLAKAIAAELKPLKMASTQLRVVQQEMPPSSWGPDGMHQVSFEVATNSGMPFGPLGKVASGGELSRLLLAMKVILRAKDDRATAIFDEIDSGTGGAVAEAIGLRLKKLAQAGQVLVVTHLPQVAALAAHHLYITKSGTKEVTTRVALLSANERAEELARMLSGATISDEARKTAAKLLEGAV